MNLNQAKLFINTLLYLKPIQIYYRIFYFIKKKIPLKSSFKKKVGCIQDLYWTNSIISYSTYSPIKKSFTFLNLEYHFEDNIDWNYSKYGKLWTYNLNYFEFLHQNDITKELGLDLILKYINRDSVLIDGQEPYPVSLRIINWIKFLSQNKINNDDINKYLQKDCYFLFNNLEYHLLGNHLLENAFSLLFSSYYFKNHKFYIKSRKLLFKELNEQILNDGGHFELSPMYHNIILNRLLDSIKLIQLNKQFKDHKLFYFLKDKASLMLSWTENITYSSGIFPMFNDSAKGLSFEPKLLLNYAKSLGLNIKKVPFSDSGYRKVVKSNYELIVDVGNIGPDYQPGHAHSDTFNFELHVNELPVIVDTGTSTYENNNVRKLERSTYSHNTVMIGESEQSEVWGSFRVGKRAKVFDLKITDNKIYASHDGYKRKGIIHSRSFRCFKNKIIIIDALNRCSQEKAIAIFHFYSSVKCPKIISNKVILKHEKIEMSFHGQTSIKFLQYDLSDGFNKNKLAYLIKVNFDQKLKTTISF